MWGWFGRWIDSLSNKIAQNQFTPGGPISVDDLTPAQKRAYLGMLISSIGSGLSAFGSGNNPNIIGSFLAGSGALNQMYDSQIRQKKIQEIINDNNISLPEKISRVAFLGDEKTANVLQRQWEAQRENEQIVSTYNAVDPKTGRVKTYGLKRDGTSVELGETPVENVPINVGGTTQIIPRLGPAPQSIPHTPSPEDIMRLQMQKEQMELEREKFEHQKWYQEELLKVQQMLANSQSNLDRARAAKELQELAMLSQAAGSMKDPLFQLQLSKLPQETQKAIVMHEQILSNIDQIIEDVEKNGKLSPFDLTGYTERGQRINTLLKSTIEYLKGPFGTGVLQEHEAKRLASILGSIADFSSLFKSKETALQGLKTTREMVAKSINAYILLLQNKLPQNIANEYLEKSLSKLENAFSKKVRVVVDPRTGQWRVVNE